MERGPSVVGDQLLAWSREAVERAGYAGAQLFGYLAGTAPHTGQLGTLSRPWFRGLARAG